MADRYDVAVVGGGAAGLSASRAAMHEGARVVLISDSPLGGDCTFTGCVPSKTLLEAAQRGASFDEAMAAVEQVVESIAATENADVLRGEGIDVIEGRARFEAPLRLQVASGHADTRIEARKIIIGTGSKPFVPSIPGLDESPHVTTEELFEVRARPTTLGIIGGGPIGAEMAQAFAGLGVAVTLYEAGERILSREEVEASAIVTRALEADGVAVHTKTRVERIEATKAGGSVVHTAAGPTAVDLLLVATGRRPNTNGLGLDEVGIAVDDRGWIETTATLATTARNVWAIGDVNGKVPLTHAADEMGRVAAWNATRPGRRYRFKPSWIPAVTFTHPEVARVGVTEADAPSSARVVELPMTENDRPRTAFETEGYIKIVVGKRPVLGNAGGGKVLGASIVGTRAGELIHEPTLAMRTNMFAGRLAQTTHAYPSWSIGIQKAMGQLYYEIEGRSARPVGRR